MRIRAVVLDMDGLMLDTEPLYQSAWAQACIELGFSLEPELYSTLIGRPAGESEAELAAHFGSRFPLDRFKVRWPALWRQAVRQRGIPGKPGLAALLALLERHRLPTAVATSSDAVYTAFSLRSAGLSGRFSVVVTRDQVPYGKPAPDTHVEAARRLGHAPADCIALEDSDAGVLAACAAGMTTICVPDLKTPSEAAARSAFRVVPSLVDATELIEATLTGLS